MTSDPEPAPFAGTPARPPWSHKLWMLAGSRERFFERLIQDYGDFVEYRGPISFYLVNHPALVKQVLQGAHDTFDKNSPLYDRFRRAFGSGLVVAEGESWKRRRAAAQKVLGPRQVEGYCELMVRAAEQAAARWLPLCRRDASFDIAPEMDRLTLEIIGRSLFQDGFDGAQESVQRWTHAIDHFSSKAPLPVIRSAWFPSPLNLRLERTVREFHGFIQRMLDSNRRDGSEGGLLSLLCGGGPDGEAAPLSDAEIRDEVLGMIVGGHETSSVALTWAWYELDRNPAVEQRLLEELDTVLGDRPIESADVPRLTYTRMVIDETLRLHPPFWFENRNVTREVELGGATLRAGDTVAFSRYALHRHPGFWNDPEVFDPNRFSPGKEENRRSTYAYVPFGGGPRVCVGVHFAMQELVVVLATLARKLRIRVDPRHRHEVRALLTMRPKHGLRVRVAQRQASSSR
ncbi:Pentalenene oxygenase [Posidoniimonas polymericola]|uniref:Pentalenene oxygenase n=1 Tax=Posidoniimonas polymericola TaxID=2528002 RepID=A0A5C5YFR7_9BACT|nr:cytochrome P450 [Posidoniimonas polymericola]TWT73633.1 Pentalenene oxygenase [Posidoniimonas polymericola]